MAGDLALGGPFWRFWGAAALTNVGDGIRLAAFPLLAAALTDSPAAVAAVVAAQGLPWLVTGLFAGSLADRRGTRPLVVGADTGRVMVLVVLIVAGATGHASVALLAVAAFLLGVGETIRDTAAQAAVPRLVPPALLERANGRLIAGEVVGNEFVGPPLGSALFVVGAVLPFAANGATMALAAVLVLSLPMSMLGRPVPHTGPGQPVAGPGVRAGLRWLAQHRTLRVLTLVVAAVAAADSAWFAIFVLYVRDSLGVGAVGFGLLLATGAAGGVAGSLVADRLIAGDRHRTVLTWSLAITAGAPPLLAVVQRLWAAIAVVVITSASFAVLNVASLSVRQRLVPEGMLGRVTATSRTLGFGATAVGALAGGALATIAGLEATFLLCGAVALTATAAWWAASRSLPPLAPAAPA